MQNRNPERSWTLKIFLMMDITTTNTKTMKNMNNKNMIHMMYLWYNLSGKIVKKIPIKRKKFKTSPKKSGNSLIFIFLIKIIFLRKFFIFIFIHHTSQKSKYHILFILTLTYWFKDEFRNSTYEFIFILLKF